MTCRMQRQNIKIYMMASRPNIEAHTKFSWNNADIAFEIGGIEGMTKVQNTLTRRYQNERNI